ncbi:Vernalization5/VIN3-like, putative isoform 2 [Hibiscus syriacus]|uniref:Vernalization5/VIN3-like, putative isoform 2 n=1 Tax=Hibiscus syriacus TaxID=106335 RepID=A0A6A2X9D4_HIBSY|nr:Vernalization5/VIN3-like, putative isoform 2 [Hibiscus syriacus]
MMPSRDFTAENNSGDHEGVTDPELHSYPTGGQRTAIRQRKADYPSRLPINVNDPRIDNGGNDTINAVYCKNSACKATLRQDDIFCKRCSCCICYKFDDNEDPSLWLLCSSEPPFPGNSCGMSCHLECALKHEKSGIGKDKRHAVLDGSFCCVACRKVNDLLRCWRKQMMAAKDTRVDILSVKKLEAEVGPLTGVPVKIGRGIVNRLSSGPEVLEFIFSFSSNSTIRRCCPTSITVIVGSEEPLQSSIIGCTLWNRKSCDRDYPVKSTCTMLVPNTRFVVAGLTPATKYLFKVVACNGTKEFGPWEVSILTCCSGNGVPGCPMMERSQSPATNYSSLSNPSSVEDETSNITPYSDQNDDRAENYSIYSKDTDHIVSTNQLKGATKCTVLGEDGILAEAVPTLEDRITEETSTDNDSDVPVKTGTECFPFVGCSEAALPITPRRMEIIKNRKGRRGISKTSSKDRENGTGKGEDPQDGRRSTSKKKIGEKMKNKFLTWYSLRATPQEARILKVFVDIFITDPPSLAEQLADTLSDCISSKGSSIVPVGFCMNGSFLSTNCIKVDVSNNSLDPLHSSCRLSMILYISPLAAFVVVRS